MKNLNLNVTSKLMLGVAVILVFMLTANYIISNNRVNDQANAGFADKLRQITGMASETRNWVASHQNVFVENNAQGENARF